MDQPDGSQPDTIVMLTALEEERRAVLAHLANLPDRRVDTDAVGTRYDVIALPVRGWQVAVACGGRGGAATSALTTQAIAAFDPAVVMFVGIAGGLRPDLQLGGVVVATKVYGIHGGRDEQAGFQVRPEAWEPDWALLQLAQQVDREQDWQRLLAAPPAPPARSQPSAAYFAPIAAGEVVLNNPDSWLAEHVRHHYNDAIAIDTEDHGFAKAMHLHAPVAGLVVRGLSDLAGWLDKHGTDAGGWRQVAADHAGAYAVAIATRYAEEHQPRSTRTRTGSRPAGAWRPDALPSPPGPAVVVGAGSVPLAMARQSPQPVFDAVEVTRFVGRDWITAQVDDFMKAPPLRIHLAGGRGRARQDRVRRAPGLHPPVPSSLRPQRRKRRHYPGRAGQPVCAADRDIRIARVGAWRDAARLGPPGGRLRRAAAAGEPVDRPQWPPGLGGGRAGRGRT